MNVLLLTVNNKQAKHYIGSFITHRPDVKIHTPQDIEKLYGLIPDLIIELPDWYMGKSAEFMFHVERIKVGLIRAQPKT